MREWPSLRCQDRETCFQVLLRLRRQTSKSCHQRQHECCGGHEVEHAVNFKARHQSRTDQRAEHRADPANQNEPSAYRHNPISRHAIVRVGDANGVEC